MAIYRLEKSSSGWVGDKTINGWSSLIWTERYRKADDFQIKTSKVDDTLDILYEGCLIGVNERDTVMIVDNLHVGKSSQGGRELTIKGRGFETILEKRAVKDGDTTFLSALHNEKPFAMASILGSRSLVDAYNNLDEIPDVIVQGSVEDSDDYPVVEYDFSQTSSDTYSEIMAILEKYDLGISAKLPKNVEDIYITINDGNIRIAGEPDEAVLRVDAGHIVDPSYYFSNVDYRNVAYVSSPIGFKVVYRDGIVIDNPLERHVLTVDASDLTDPAPLSVDDALTLRGLTELRSHNREVLFDGQVSLNNNTVYGQHYDIGDIVTVVGEYGGFINQRVVENILTVDENGWREYPTFEAVS